MTTTDLRKDLGQALQSLNRGGIVPAKRVEQWAAALERTERDHPDPGSRHFSAIQLRARAARGDMASLKTEIRIVLAKLDHWRSMEPDQSFPTHDPARGSMRRVEQPEPEVHVTHWRPPPPPPATAFDPPAR